MIGCQIWLGASKAQTKREFPVWLKNFWNAADSNVPAVANTHMTALPLVLIAVSILVASLSGSKSLKGTTVGYLGSVYNSKQITVRMKEFNHQHWVNLFKWLRQKKSLTLPQHSESTVPGTLTPEPSWLFWKKKQKPEIFSLTTT